MSLKRLNPGKRMSQGVKRGKAVYLAGQVAEETKGGSVAEQTAEVLAQIDALLAEAGTDKTKIMMATIYLADISTFAEMNGEWDKWVVEGDDAGPRHGRSQAGRAGIQGGNRRRRGGVIRFALPRPANQRFAPSGHARPCADLTPI